MAEDAQQHPRVAPSAPPSAAICRPISRSSRRAQGRRDDAQAQGRRDVTAHRCEGSIGAAGLADRPPQVACLQARRIPGSGRARRRVHPSRMKSAAASQLVNRSARTSRGPRRQAPAPVGHDPAHHQGAGAKARGIGAGNLQIGKPGEAMQRFRKRRPGRQHRPRYGSERDAAAEEEELLADDGVGLRPVARRMPGKPGGLRWNGPVECHPAVQLRAEQPAGQRAARLCVVDMPPIAPFCRLLPLQPGSIKAVDPAQAVKMAGKSAQIAGSCQNLLPASDLRGPDRQALDRRSGGDQQIDDAHGLLRLQRAGAVDEEAARRQHRPPPRAAVPAPVPALRLRRRLSRAMSGWRRMVPVAEQGASRSTRIRRGPGRQEATSAPTVSRGKDSRRRLLGEQAQAGRGTIDGDDAGARRGKLGRLAARSGTEVKDTLARTSPSRVAGSAAAASCTHHAPSVKPGRAETAPACTRRRLPPGSRTAASPLPAGPHRRRFHRQVERRLRQMGLGDRTGRSLAVSGRPAIATASWRIQPRRVLLRQRRFTLPCQPAQDGVDQREYGRRGAAAGPGARSYRPRRAAASAGTGAVPRPAEAGPHRRQPRRAAVRQAAVDQRVDLAQPAQQRCRQLEGEGPIALVEQPLSGAARRRHRRAAGDGQHGVHRVAARRCARQARRPGVPLPDRGRAGRSGEISRHAAKRAHGRDGPPECASAPGPAWSRCVSPVSRSARTRFSVEGWVENRLSMRPAVQRIDDEQMRGRRVALGIVIGDGPCPPLELAAARRRATAAGRRSRRRRGRRQYSRVREMANCTSIAAIGARIMASGCWRSKPDCVVAVAAEEEGRSWRASRSRRRWSRSLS